MPSAAERDFISDTDRCHRRRGKRVADDLIHIIKGVDSMKARELEEGWVQNLEGKTSR